MFQYPATSKTTTCCVFISSVAGQPPEQACPKSPETPYLAQNAFGEGQRVMILLGQNDPSGSISDHFLQLAKWEVA
jgi:hypothetical protein